MDINQTEEQQVEAIKKFWHENGNSIIAGVVIGLGGFVGYNLYQDHKLEQETAIADAYQAVVEKAAEDSSTFTQSAREFIDANGDSGYVSLTALALAKTAADAKDWPEAAKQLTLAAEKAQAEGIKSIALVRLARVLIQQEKYTEALDVLAKPMAASFTAAVEELKGDVYLAQDKKELARNAYQAALGVESQAGNQALQMKLDDLAESVNL
ncbi:YfgM family protein [Thalassotalea fusca]